MSLNGYLVRLWSLQVFVGNFLIFALNFCRFDVGVRFSWLLIRRRDFRHFENIFVFLSFNFLLSARLLFLNDFSYRVQVAGLSWKQVLLKITRFSHFLVFRRVVVLSVDARALQIAWLLNFERRSLFHVFVDVNVFGLVLFEGIELELAWNFRLVSRFSFWLFEVRFSLLVCQHFESTLLLISFVSQVELRHLSHNVVHVVVRFVQVHSRFLV